VHEDGWVTVWIITGIAISCVLFWALHLLWRKEKIAQLYRTPLPAFAVEILKLRVPLYSRLPVELKNKLHGHINYFLHDKAFIGCKGLEITDEIRLTIAGNACLLVLNRSRTIFPGFSTILVYPDTYVAKAVTYDGLVETHGHSVRLGESWHRGPVILSWTDVLAGSANPEDGHNVVLHEFAHKLDEENSRMDGLPLLRNKQQYADWARILSHEFEAFLGRVRKHKNSVVDAYGALSSAEFFAVITEVFFEKPLQMQNKLPDLYAQLKGFYQVDPAAWHV